MTRTTVGVIGTGRIGRMHTLNLVSSVPDAFVKAVASRSVDSAWAAKLGIPVCTQDIGELLGDPEIEAIVIALPSGLHAEAIQSAAAAGKHVFCEKPVGFSAAAIAPALSAVRSAGVQLQVGFNRRFDPSLCKLQAAVQGGEVGALHSLRVVNRDPRAPELDFARGSGGMFLDFTIHDFDTLRFLSGSEIVEIYAAGDALVDPEIASVGDIDTAVISVRLANGALCVIDNSRQTGYGYDQRFEAFGSKGNLAADNLRPTSVEASLGTGVFSDPPYPSFVERYKDAFIAELRAFVSCVRNGSAVTVTGEDALAAVEAALAAKTSLTENRPVQLAPAQSTALEGAVS